ncbi:triacylglycerol lipase [Cucurbitaria berberidis CBS 394.84]|uniref:Patatin-like phospholipase domain-containing protein n=1 Tax=Cucurbitaria berberidis CBS 394.84 TaxID=1168544 RepID=A0A9P4G9V7_9PLEO|nr:triacylglycerol lipase [Cucurbitaria berberidis CBS 394.84]KAF1841681.1 triacylglycerol lipase [Cucurbitaria berberidis CBS 394.84]
MSLLSDTVLAGGSTRLHIAGRGQKSAQEVLRKSKSHGSFLTPLVQLVRDPAGTLGSAIGNYNVPDTDAAASEAHRRQILYLRMKDAESYDEWKAAATELDVLEGNEAWKEQHDSPEYDAALVAARLRELDHARLDCDVRRMLFLIRTTLTRGLGDMGQLRLYKHSHIGTKRLIERYIDSAQQTMAALLDVSAKQGDQCPVEPRRLVEQLLQTRQSFGRSALLLSGGGTFGMNHIGVVKCLWEARLLPRIISGASAGSIVSAVLCTKTDEEIPDVLHEFCYGDLNVFDNPSESDTVIHKAVRMLKSGVLFDISHLMRVMRGLLGDITFQEAYNRTRRILNIPVSTSSLYELPRLLNYITAPNVMIWSAVCTSCSVPLVYKKASLLAKDPKTGREVPWDPNPDTTWIDGSVDNDLPMTRLAELFNVNHFIVSQVNPHVVPFLAKEEEIVAAEAHQGTTVPAGPSWLSTAASLARGEVLHRLQGFADIGFLPNIVTKARSVLSQRYSGDINIFPKISYADFPRVLSNPTTEYMIGCMLTGQRATWPKLSRIQNHVAIELALDDTIQKLRARVVFFTPSQVDLRLNNLGRPLSHGNDLAPVHRTKSVHKITRFKLKTEPPSPILRKSAPTSPLLSRATLRSPFQTTPKQHYKSDASKPRSSGALTIDASSLDVISSSANDSSDQDYFADPESDTTDVLSSPSPPTSPSVQGLTLWPSVRQTPMIAAPHPTTTYPATPAVTTAIDRRTGTLLNLAMTSATGTSPSSPERRYKRLFHPDGPITPEPNSGASRLELRDISTPPHTETKSNSRPGSRRGSGGGNGSTLGLTLDHSGTRGMLLRKKSYKQMTPDDPME